MKKRGFTFIEVMISLLLLMIGIVFLINLFPIALKSFQKAKDVTIAAFLAQEKMEEIRNLPEEETISDNSTNPEFKHIINIKPWPDNESEDYEEIIVKSQNILSKAYAEVNTIRKSSGKSGDMYALTIPSSSPWYFNIIFFATQPKDKNIYYNDCKYKGAFYDKNEDSPWRSCGALPEDADKVSAGLVFVQVSNGDVALAGSQVFVYATDKKGHLYGAVFSLSFTGNTINLDTERSWTELKRNPLTPQPR